jgi:DNA-binding CsgD family transcriptional regulator
MNAESQRLSSADIRRVFHLLGEIIELGRDAARWRAHLLEQLLKLVDARIGLAGEQFVSPTAPMFVGMVEAGWEPHQQKLFYQHVNSGGMAKDPLHKPVQSLLFRSFTRRRRDIVPDDVWYSSPTLPIRRECNFDDQIYSRWRLPQPGWAHVITVFRAWKGNPFGVRERLIVNLLHRELGRLWSQVDSGPLASMPPRLRQTLDLIFSGYTEKQIADCLNVSTHTAHDFCRRLYRHFALKGRGQLLTNPACRQLLFRPALSPAYYAQNRGETQGTFPAP